MGFIRVLNQKGHSLESSMRCHELINTKTILHVYICLPDEERICIEYMTKHGKQDIIEDHFADKNECLNRFYEIEQQLKEER